MDVIILTIGIVFMFLFIEILLIGRVLYDYLVTIEKVIINILKILSVENVSGNKFDFKEARENIKIIEGNTTSANLNENPCKDCGRMSVDCINSSCKTFNDRVKEQALQEREKE